MFLKWQPIYSVNVKEIDEQHQKMFSLIEKVFEVKKNYSKELVAVIIKELRDYGAFHLDVEEKYFIKFNYPDKEAHILQHNKYREKVIDFENRINQTDDRALVKEMAHFLKDWWLGHIQYTDQKYSDFFNLHGLT